jgi:hypothetical protein
MLVEATVGLQIVNEELQMMKGPPVANGARFKLLGASVEPGHYSHPRRERFQRIRIQFGIVHVDTCLFILLI